MNRIGIVFAFVAAPLMAQVGPVPVRPDPAPAVAARAADRADAAQARAEAQAARVSDRVEAMAARAYTVRPNFNLDVRPQIGPVEVHVGQGVGVGIGAGPAIADYKYNYSYNYNLDNMRARDAWAPQDPADSLYRQAQQAMSRGDYRRAAALFKDLPVKQPNSVYAS